MNVIGLDLSLTSTGVATQTETSVLICKLRGYPRLRWIRDAVVERCADADLVVVEGPSYHSTGSAIHQIAGMWWMVTMAVDEQHPMAVAPPSTIKRFATGRGNADKDAMLLAAARRFDWFDGDNNQADALWACAMGHEWIKESIVTLPRTHRVALDGVAWP